MTADDRAGAARTYGGYAIDDLWALHKIGSTGWEPIYGEDEDDDGSRLAVGIGWMPPFEGQYEPLFLLWEDRDDDWQEADCRLGAAARNALPDLLAAVQSLGAALDAAEVQTREAKQEREIAELKLQHIYKAAELEYSGADPITALRNLRDERDEAQVEAGHLLRSLKALCAAYDVREWGQLYDAFQIARTFVIEEPAS